MDDKQIRIIDAILAKGDRVELIPGPRDTVKVIRIKREIIKNEITKDRSKY